MADAPGDQAPGEAGGDGAGKAPKRRKGEAPPPKQQRFVLSEHVDSVVTLPWDVLHVDEDLTHGQVVPPPPIQSLLCPHHAATWEGSGEGCRVERLTPPYLVGKLGHSGGRHWRRTFLQ